MLTVFTTSAYCGGSNGAGAAYIAQGTVRMVSVSLGSTSSTPAPAPVPAKSRPVPEPFLPTPAPAPAGPLVPASPPSLWPAKPYKAMTTHAHPRRPESPVSGAKRRSSGSLEYPPFGAPFVATQSYSVPVPVHGWPDPPPSSTVFLPSYSGMDQQWGRPDRQPSGF